MDSSYTSRAVAAKTLASEGSTFPPKPFHFPRPNPRFFIPRRTSLHEGDSRRRNARVKIRWGRWFHFESNIPIRMSGYESATQKVKSVTKCPLKILNTKRCSMTSLNGVDITPLDGWMVKINNKPSVFGKSTNRRWFRVSEIQSDQKPSLLLTYASTK